MTDGRERTLVIGIVLIEVCYWVKNFALPQDFCHAYIAAAVREHLENLPHNVGCRRVYNQVMSVVWVFYIPKRGVSAEIHPCLCSCPVRRLGLGRGLPCIVGIDYICERQHEIIDAAFCAWLFRYRACH